MRKSLAMSVNGPNIAIGRFETASRSWTSVNAERSVRSVVEMVPLSIDWMDFLWRNENCKTFFC